MTVVGRYEFVVEQISERRVSGWCRNLHDSQPVELAFVNGSAQLFSIVANSPVILKGDSKASFVGFDLTLDTDFWRVAERLALITPDGNAIAVLERPLVSVRARNEQPAIVHNFTSTNLSQISGRFRFGQATFPEHFVKLFSFGVLRAYQSIQEPVVGLDGMEGTEGAGLRSSEQSGEVDKNWLEYKFFSVVGREFMSRLAIVTINDQFAFITTPHQTVSIKTDETIYLIPLPVELKNVLKTTTVGCDRGDQVMLYATRQYLGFGSGAILTFDRTLTFEQTIRMADETEIQIKYSPNSLYISQG